jgi:glycosyltransferase involved in cell wall biosynthesis
MANQNELVSIVMATYNGGKYLSEQLNSIIQQTYRNIEIVIVDDSSTDDTVEIIKKYQQQFSFISLHINETNNGVTVTFAKAIAESKGSLIAISDQDDIWELNKIETLVNNIEDFDAVYSNSLLVDAHGNSLNKSFTSIMNMKTYRCGAPFLLSNSVPGHTMLIRNSFAKTLFPFPPTVLFDLWICFCASSNNGIKYVDEILVKCSLLIILTLIFFSNSL